MSLRESPPQVRHRTGPAVRAAWTAGFWERPGPRGYVISVAAALFLVLARAFDSGGLSLPIRLLYWLVLMVGGTALGQAIHGWVSSRPALQDRTALQVLTTSVLMTVPYTWVVWIIVRLLVGAGGAPNPLLLVGPVFAVSVVMTTLNAMASRQPLETHASAPGAPAPRFLERLPHKLKGAEVYAVEAQEHYVRVHTSRGADLILLRLSDAVAELEGLEGAQTHRSWWVAKDAVTDARRADGRAVLVLKSGVEAPVSRTYAKALRDEGWF